MSKIKVNEIEAATGSTVTIPTGQTFSVVDGIPATNLSGTIADARLPTVPVSKGGTGVTSLGTAGQALKVNSGATGLEFGSISSSTFAQAPVITTSTASGSTTGSTKVWNGLSVDITPTSASNKVLIYVQQQQRFHQGGGGSGDGGGFHNYLYRGDTNTTIGAMNAAISGFGGTQSQIWYQMYCFWNNSTSQIETDLMSYMFIDSPNTTNLCRYFTAASNHNGNEHISWKIDGGTSLMYAIELKS